MSRPPISERAALFMLASVHFVNLLNFMMVMPMGPDFAGALATGSASLVAARVAAGAFGGVAATLCFSIVADLVPDERRGRATAIVASGFSLSSIAGVPMGLELARRGGWRAPFLVVGAIALLLAVSTRLLLPKLRAHLDTKEKPAPLPLDARMGLSFAAFACSVLGNFLLIPNLSAYLQFNMGFPRERMGLLYVGAGLATLAAMRLAGAWTDRSGAFRPALTGSLLVSTTLVLGAVIQPRYLSAQNAFVHGGCAVAAFASSAFLSEEASGKLIGMPALSLTAAILSLGVPVAVWFLEKRMPLRRAPVPATLVAEI